MHGAKGLDGALRIEPLTDWPERLAPGAELYLAGEPEPRRVTAVERGGRSTVLRIDGITSREQAESLRDRYLEVESRPLPAGAYYWHQIVGLRVTDAAGAELGRVAEVFRAGENEVYAISKPDGAELLIPALASVVRRIDLDAGLIVVDYDAEEVG